MRLSIPERREAVAELAADGMSQREIGDVLGVTQMTVSRDLSVTNVTDAQPAPSENNGLHVPTVANVTPLDTVATLAADESLRAEAVRKGLRPPGRWPLALVSIRG